jgi:hypothetical protein
MKALSVCQPWAWAIIAGIKRIENRTWRTRYRGRLLIHASKSRRYLGRDYSDLLPGLPPLDQLHFGVIIGEVELVDCVPVEEIKGDVLAKGPWCWRLKTPRSISKPISWCGGLSLFNVPDYFFQ